MKSKSISKISRWQNNPPMMPKKTPRSPRKNQNFSKTTKTQILITNSPHKNHLWFVLMNAKRSEEHTSELQSRGHLVCRLLLEKKNKKQITDFNSEITFLTMITFHL